MISKGYIKEIAKFVSIQALFRFSYETTRANRHLATPEEQAILGNIEERLSYIRDALDEYIKVKTQKLSDADFKVLKSKSISINHIIANHLGYMGIETNLYGVINRKRDVKAWDLDIIALYLLDKIIDDDFPKTSEYILSVARYINSCYNGDMKKKFRDKLEHIGRANTIEMYW